MLRFTATNAVISRGFDNKSAVKFSEDGSVVRFRIGERVYDKNAENNTRWVNINIKAFGNVAERIRKMQLKDGSCINLTGRYDEDTWTDQNTGEPRSQPVIILDDIEFAGSRPKAEKKSDEPGSAAPADREAPLPGRTLPDTNPSAAVPSSTRAEHTYEFTRMAHMGHSAHVRHFRILKGGFHEEQSFHQALCRREGGKDPRRS